MRTSTLSFTLLASLPLSLSAPTDPKPSYWNWSAYQKTSDTPKAGSNFIDLSTIDTINPNLYHNPAPSGPPTCIKISNTTHAQMMVKLGGSAQGGCSPFDQIVPFRTADCTGEVVETAAKKVDGGSSGQLDAVTMKWPDDHDQSKGWLSFQVKPCANANANVNAKEKRMSTECGPGFKPDHPGKCVRDNLEGGGPKRSTERRISTECPKWMVLNLQGKCVWEGLPGGGPKRSTEKRISTTECGPGLMLNRQGKCVREDPNHRTGWEGKRSTECPEGRKFDQGDGCAEEERKGE